MPYSLHERALYTLLAVDESRLRDLVSAIERLEADPAGQVQAAGRDSSGEVVNICFAGPFRIHFVIEPNGMVFIRDILAR